MSITAFFKKKKVSLDSEIDELKKEQDSLGKELYLALSEAAIQNKVYNVMNDGTIDEKMGPITVEFLSDNAGQYTVVTSVSDPSSFSMGGFRNRGHSILQADINVKEKNLHVFHGPYGPEQNYSLDSFKEFKKVLINNVKTFSMFK